MNTALVLNVQRFSVHDGPGIRTTVFFKGCPLHCPWCHNPESMDFRPEIAIKDERCLGCDACAPVCPEEGAGRLDLTPDTGRPGAVCLRCGACADACPSGARDLLGWRIGVEDLVAELERDREFYAESGGGVTFSGGEPAAPDNAAFLLECLHACRARGLHTAVDTCGHVPRETLLAVADRADLVLYDLKLMDPERHRASVGVDNRLILANLREMAASGREMRIRVPLIPGRTDDEANLRAIADFVAALDRTIPVHLLPHHGTAGEKYRRLGLVDEMAGVPAPTDAQVAERVEWVRAAGLTVKVGG